MFVLSPNKRLKVTVVVRGVASHHQLGSAHKEQLSPCNWLRVWTSEGAAEASSPSCQEFKQTASRKFPLKWRRWSQTSKRSVKSIRFFLMNLPICKYLFLSCLKTLKSDIYSHSQTCAKHLDRPTAPPPKKKNISAAYVYRNIWHFFN